MFQKLIKRLVGVIFRFRLIILALIILSVPLFTYLLYKKHPDVRSCYMHQIPPDVLASYTDTGIDITVPQLLEDILMSELKPEPGRSIFFHETSCHQITHSHKDSIFGSMSINTNQPTLNLVKLNARQACAIESAALHNKNSNIFVLFASPTYQTNVTLQHPLIEAILSYPNVYLRNLNMWTYVANTPIHEWFLEGILFKSTYVISHISDFLRYLTLYRWGGTYLDMDIVMLRAIEDLPPNFTGVESNNHIAAGVINFASTGFGHDIAAQCLHDFQVKFDGTDWGNNGPGVITRVMQSVCGTKYLYPMLSDRTRCMGINVLPREAFYAIPWKDWLHFFDESYLDDMYIRTKESYVIHLWNKHSKDTLVKVGSNAPYGKFAEVNCPKAYAASGEYF